VNQRVQFSPEQRLKLLAEFEQSGLSATEFARRHGMCRTLLAVWRRRYIRPVATVIERAAAPVEVPLREISFNQLVGPPPWAAELVLPGGITLRLDTQGQAQLLAHLRQHLTL
jgi:transcriptional regulator with XRE-family HTH domain